MPQFFDNDQPEEKPLEDQEKEKIDDDPVKLLIEWQAPARPFRKKTRSFYTNASVIVALLVLISLLAQEIMLIGVILALTFVAYVFGFIPPEEINYKISKQGITIGEHFYHWDTLDSFWFAKKDGFPLLHVLTNLRFPAQLIIMIDEEKQEEIKRIIAKYLPFHEIAPRSALDKWSEGLQKHFPLENKI